MTTATNSAADQEPMTAEQWAAVDFEPWAHREDEWKPPTGEEWQDHIRHVFPWIRLAWEVMFKTKTELETIADELEDEPLEGLIDRIAHSREFFENFVTVLTAAECRLLWAAAAAELRAGEAEAGP